MNIGLVSYRRAGAVGMIAALLLAGCTSRSDGGRAGATAGARSGAAMAHIPGALSKPIGSYTSRDLYGFVQGIDSVVGPIQPRCSQPRPACTPTALAQIVVLKGQETIGPADAVGHGYGTIVMRIRNTGIPGGPEDEKYKLKTGHFIYYMLALPDGAGGMRWELWGIPEKNAAAPPSFVTYGTWTLCGHAPPTVVDGRFGTCDNVHDQIVRKLAGDPWDPAWMTCSSGCCTADEAE